MSGKLAGRTALITGSSRGIGAVVARAFAREGARCLLTARNVAGLDRVVGDISAAGGDARAFALDLESVESVRAAIAELKASTPKLDIFVANAALGGVRLPIADYPLDDWMRTFQVNVHANLLLLAGLHPLLAKSDAGRVVIVSTGVSRLPKAHTGAYAVSKAALEAMAAIYAVENADTPIRINMMNPGPTRTEMRAAAFPKEDPQTVKPPEALLPLFFELASAGCARQGEWIAADKWLAEAAARAQA
jgi:NAD(P)-dependent dehydrogenase (short-subunit alcohol dehydrogenase family)